jgi:hypothetical protein
MLAVRQPLPNDLYREISEGRGAFTRWPKRRAPLLRRKLGRYRRDPKHLYSFKGAM